MNQFKQYSKSILLWETEPNPERSNRPCNKCDAESGVRHFSMSNYPQDGFDTTDDDELSDEMLNDVSGGAVVGIPIAP